MRTICTRLSVLLAFALFLLPPSPVLGAGPKTIEVVTPAWEGQTNKDGTGLFFQIVRETFEPAGVRMTYRFAPWKRSQEMVAKGEADAMLCVWKAHAEEMGQLVPRYPMFVEYTAAVWKRGAMPDWKGIDSLNGKRAVWLRGYDYHTFSHFDGVSFARWTEVDDYDAVWRILEHNRVDVYIDAPIDVNKYIADHGTDMSGYRKEILWGENAYAAFSDNEKCRRLISVFDRGMKKLYESGRLAAIYGQWGATVDLSAWESIAAEKDDVESPSSP